MGFAILAIGLVLCVEGLVLALAPSRMEDLLAAFAQMPASTRRLIGIVALAIGVGLTAFARARYGF
ncbi:DUF2065 domain-containing protein [Celeribacter sp.]|uniref:DUF2065 domain-containing protein n=1 Tax=Celeribacter sp. TaxID=1890673 RepID=UPI003A8D3C71